MKINRLLLNEHIYLYTSKIRPINSQTDVEIMMYFKPLNTKKNENGFVIEYEILKITDIENYLLGNTDKSSHKHTYKAVDVPEDVKTVFKGLSVYNIGL